MIIDKEIYKNVAKEFRVNLTVVAKYVIKAKKNIKFFEDLLSNKREEHARRRDIEDVVRRMNEEDSFIDSAESVKKKALAERGVVTNEREVRSVLKEDLGMRFKKLKHITFKANSVNNLVLR